MASSLAGSLVALVIALLVAFAAPGVRAQPQVPATFFGTASVDGRPVSDGTEVRAFIGGEDCTQLGENYRTTVRNGPVAEYAVQVMHESQEPGCGSEGREVTFAIGGRPANETATWKAGVQNVNLNAGSGAPQPLPTPTATSTIDPAAAAATATETARFTPRPTEDGPPPTDDVTAPIGSSTRRADTPTVPAPGTLDEDDGGFPVLGVVGLMLLGLVLLGGAAGYALRRPWRAAR